MKKSSFSLLEVIFVVAILSLMAVVALPKFGNSLDKANMIKIQSDITLIRNGINEYKNKMIMLNNEPSLETLDDSDVLLFGRILKNPVISSEIPKATFWSKISNNKYKVWIDTTNSLKFTYNKSEFTFDCNLNDQYCKELTQ